MAFFESQFPTDISYGAQGGPVWSTSRAYTDSGRRISNRNWTYPLCRFDASYGVKKLSQFEAARAFFYNVGGAADGFRWKDWSDYQDRGAGVLTLVSGSDYQLYKNYTTGARTYSRKIQKPVAGTLVIIRTRSGTPSDITGSSTIDTTTGIVTVSGHVSGDTYTWTGEFDVPVAFSSDEWRPQLIARSGSEVVLQSGDLELEEIRL